MRALLLTSLIACHTQAPAPTAPTTTLGPRPHPCDIPPAPVRPLILSEEPKEGVLILSGEQFNVIVKYEVDFVAWAQIVMSCER